MKAIQNQGGIGAMLLYRTDIGLAHIATGPFNLFSLEWAEMFFKEFVNGFTALSLADPNDPRLVQIINDGGVLMPFAVGYFINPESE